MSPTLPFFLRVFPSRLLFLTCSSPSTLVTLSVAEALFSPLTNARRVQSSRTHGETGAADLVKGIQNC